MICPTAKAEYFSRAIWTTQITLNRLTNSAFRRTRFGSLKALQAKLEPEKFI
jgi:hypothetical protein